MVEKMEKIKIDGILFEDLAPDRLAERLLAPGADPCWVVTPNALMLQAAREDRALYELLASASVAVPDGRGVRIAARRQHCPLPHCLPGIALGEAILALSARRGLRVFLLGGEDGVAATAAERLCRRYRGLQICGHFWGYFEQNGTPREELLALINATHPDVLFVCLGFPRQEQWIAENRALLPTLRLAIGLGGSLDVWAGRVTRAPLAVRALSLEWAWRMLSQPRRLRQLPMLVRFFFSRGARE